MVLMRRIFPNIFVFLALIAMLSVSAASEPLVNKLVDYWSLDANSSTQLGSLGKINGSTVNSPKYVTANCAGSGCYYVNGTASVNPASTFTTGSLGSYITGDSDVCLSYWSDYDFTSNGWLYYTIEGPDPHIYRVLFGEATTASTMKLGYIDGSGASKTSAYSPNMTGLHHHLDCRINDNNLISWQDNVLIINETLTDRNPANVSYALTFVGQSPPIYNYGTSSLNLIDELAMFSELPNLYERARLANQTPGEDPFYPFDQDSVFEESLAQEAILEGIAASEASSGVSYNDTKLALRLANGTQVNATVTVYLSYNTKRWVINYRESSSMGFPTLYEIAPAFYYLNLANLNSDEIAQNVSAFINSTFN